MSAAYLPDGLPDPLDDKGVNAPYWSGLLHGELRVQRCAACATWQFGGEHLCHRCHTWDPPWLAVEARGRIFSWARVWHAAHPALQGHVPYLAVLVELPHAGGLRMLGNLLGDAMQNVVIGAEVEGVFEPHAQGDPPYALLQWRRV